MQEDIKALDRWKELMRGFYSRNHPSLVERSTQEKIERVKNFLHKKAIRSTKVVKDESHLDGILKAFWEKSTWRGKKTEKIVLRHDPIVLKYMYEEATITK